ncbi:MAG: NUDIX domain-containing protein [Candidatus Absconditabacteria bacterium]
MDFRFHTKAILTNTEGKILVQRRSDTGKWDLIGGKTELPEKIEEAMVREIKEETGIETVQDLRVIHVESDFLFSKTRYFVLIIYTGKVDVAGPIISDEHLEYQRVNKEKLFSIGMTEYLEKALRSIEHLF